MAARDPLADWWVHTVTVERYLGSGAEGDVFDTPATVRCFVSETRRLVRSATGEQVVAEATVLMSRDEADVPTESRVTLHAPFQERSSVVIASSRHDGGGQPTPDHVEVNLS